MDIQIGNLGGRTVVGKEVSSAQVSAKAAVLRHSADNTGRFGLFDLDASPLTPNQLISLLFDYLVESNKGTGGAARSVATSHLVNRVAEPCGLSAFETPVGFKYIGELINEDEIVIRGKESAEPSIQGHYSEKDGILACLRSAQAVASCGAVRGKQLIKQYLGGN